MELFIYEVANVQAGCLYRSAKKRADIGLALEPAATFGRRREHSERRQWGRVLPLLFFKIDRAEAQTRRFSVLLIGGTVIGGEIAPSRQLAARADRDRRNRSLHLRYCPLTLAGGGR
jgi:hypothetical protein